MSVEFNDFSRIVLQKIQETGEQFLEEVGGEVEAQTKRNTKVDTGQTKGSWEHRVDEQKLEAQVGSRNKNAIWEEFGTGIYALNGNGRRTKWTYKSPKDGKFYTTVGKKPRRAFYYAYKKARQSNDGSSNPRVSVIPRIPLCGSLL